MAAENPFCAPASVSSVRSNDVEVVLLYPPLTSTCNSDRNKICRLRCSNPIRMIEVRDVFKNASSNPFPSTSPIRIVPGIEQLAAEFQLGLAGQNEPSDFECCVMRRHVS